ncbi:MAG: hypothetical protein FWH20_00565 [Oscillospiraceae bacterium]|nr:hypothetical protein [Oscillospiraceae bacterium]
MGFGDDVDYKVTGTTNHHTVINNAINALPASGGKIILREGTYTLGATVNMNKNNVTLEGMGKSTILQRSGQIIEGTALNCTIKGLTFNRMSGDGYVFRILNTSQTLICENVFNGGTMLVSGNDVVVKGNFFKNSQLRIDASNSTVIGNVVDSSNSEGINVIGRNVAVTGNKCFGCLTGISLNPHYEHEGCSVVGNVCVDCNAGIVIMTNRNNISGNNIIRGTGLASNYTTTQYSIELQSGAQGNFVIGNNILGKAVTNNSGNTTNTITQNKHLNTAAGW